MLNIWTTLNISIYDNDHYAVVAAVLNNSWRLLD